MSVIPSSSSDHSAAVLVDFNLKKSIESLTDKQIYAIARQMLNLVATQFRIDNLGNQNFMGVRIWCQGSESPYSVDGNRVKVNCGVVENLCDYFPLEGAAYDKEQKEIRDEREKLRKCPLTDQKMIKLSIPYLVNVIKEVLKDEEITKGFLFKFDKVTIVGKFKAGPDDKITIVFRTTLTKKYRYDLDELTKMIS